jgi:hypothetical protein
LITLLLLVEVGVVALLAAAAVLAVLELVQD